MSCSCLTELGKKKKVGKAFNVAAGGWESKFSSLCRKYTSL